MSKLASVSFSDILNNADRALEEIPQVSNLPPGVNRMALSIENNFQTTAEALIMSAKALEERAKKLRDKAEWLLANRRLADDLREAIQYERDCWDEAKSLALVAVPDRRE